MASIQTLTRKNGEKSYRCYVKHGTKTFTRQFRKLGDARAWAKELEADDELLEHAPGAVARKMTLTKAIDQYVEQYDGKDMAIVSRMGWWKEQAGYLKLSQVTTPLVTKLLNKLAKGEAQRNHTKGLKRPRSPATVNRYRQSLSSLMAFAVKQQWTARNPVTRVASLREDNTRERYLSDAERTALLEACKVQDWDGLHVVVTLALATGARRGELASLTWNNVDLKSGVITLTKTKNGKTRTVPLVSSALAALEDWSNIRRLDSPLVFPGRVEPKKTRNFESAWQSARKAAGIEDFRFHDLRHSCASYLAQNNVSLVTIASVLGHTSLTVTQRYAHLSTDAQADALTGALEGKL